MPTSTLIVLGVAFIMDTCLNQSALNVSKLHDDLRTLNPYVRLASDVTQPTQVRVSFHLSSIISLDTASQKLVSNGWLNVTWHNPYMTWDPEDYGGVRRISPRPGRLWKPRLTVLNTLEDLQPIGGDCNVLSVLSTEDVFWFLAERLETFCRVDVTFFPFDEQRCRWKFYGWTEAVNQIILHTMLPKIDLDSFQESGEWSLIDSKAWDERHQFEGFPFSVVAYEVTLRRNSTFLTLTVLLPLFVQCLVKLFVFAVPSEAGERLTYSMTSFLSHGVFMSFIVHLMPSSAETLSIVAATQSCELTLSGVYVLLCILSLRLFHRDPDQQPVPRRLQTVVVRLEVMLCLDPPPDAAASQRDEILTKVNAISPEGRDDVFEAKMTGNGRNGYLDRWAAKNGLKGYLDRWAAKNGLKGYLDRWAAKNGLKGYLDRWAAKNGLKGYLDRWATKNGLKGYLDRWAAKNGLKGYLDRWAARGKVKLRAYSQPQPQDMTWQRVSRSLDKLVFRFFLGSEIASAAVVTFVFFFC